MAIDRFKKNISSLMNNLLIFIGILIVFIGCQDSNQTFNNNLKTFSLKGFTNTSTVKLSDLGFVDIEYVPLETNKNSMFGRIVEIQIDSGFYIVKHYNTILKFQDNGLFVTKVGAEGRGPEEFLVSHDIDIDQRDHHIYLVDGWARKFYVFDENGKFLKSFGSPFNSINFKLIQDGILCYCTNYIGNVDTSYVLINKNGQIIKSFSNRYLWDRSAQNVTLVFTENIFYEFNNQLFKKEAYSDTIYLFEDKIFKPHLVIEHGERLLTTYGRSKFELDYLSENIISQKKIFEFGDYIYYEFVFNKASYILLGSKVNEYQVFIRYNQGLINDLDGGPAVLPKTIRDDYTIISWIDAIDLKKYVSSEEFKNSRPKYPEKKEELKELANSLKETDNPVLILVKL